jgi:hypothetical protein
MTDFKHTLILNNITVNESFTPFNSNFDEYKRMAFLFLNRKGKYLFEEDILKNHKKGFTLEKLFEQEPERFVAGPNQKKGEKNEKTWYDLEGMEEIKREDVFFDYFFICKLRHESLLDLDEFLDFHLDYSFKNNRPDFLRFLNLALRQHNSLLKPDTIQTVHEWISAEESEKENADISAENDVRIKGRIERQANDNLTSLSLDQTALLIQFMQEARIILKGDNLTYTHAGKAFSMLTGYSSHTLRQQLGKKGSIDGVKYEDYKELYEVITRLASLIEPKIRKK